MSFYFVVFLDVIFGCCLSLCRDRVAEQRRKRLQELEAQIVELRRKMTEQAKMLRIKEGTDKQVEKLNQEITVCIAADSAMSCCIGTLYSGPLLLIDAGSFCGFFNFACEKHCCSHTSV